MIDIRQILPRCAQLEGAQGIFDENAHVLLLTPLDSTSWSGNVPGN